jgi:formamidopyrimidine-DNA glycosylase
MPEGDVVWRTARQLDHALTGRVLTRADFRVPRYATTDLTGETITGTESRGKHLLTRVDNGLTIHTHLRMDGSWRIRSAGGPAPRDYRIRLVLANDTWQAIGYLLGVVEIISSINEERVVGHLGPDLLGPGWNAAEAVRRLSASPDRAVGEALLDQRNLAGIGNMYKAEVLFLRGIDPWRPVGDVADLTALVELARRLLEANKNRVGQVTTGSTGRGQETWVYGRKGRPCRRCGTTIRGTTVPGTTVPGTTIRGTTVPGTTVRGTGLRDGTRSETRGTRFRDGARGSNSLEGAALRVTGPGTGGTGGGGREVDAEERVTFWCPHCQPAAG